MYLRCVNVYLGVHLGVNLRHISASISGVSRVYLGYISQMLMMAGSESNFFASAPVFVHTIKKLQVFAEIFAEILPTVRARRRIISAISLRSSTGV